jgi:membrane protein YdbS with pleckstrin-like domain
VRRVANADGRVFVAEAVTSGCADIDVIETIARRCANPFRGLSGLLQLGLAAKQASVAETSSGPPEEIVWRGTSSQWKNFGVYFLCGLFCWLLVPIFFALARYLQTKCKVFELTTQRFKITSGVFTKTTETLELYRVKDIETRQPFLSRLVGIENVQMTTSDASSPLVLVDAVPSSVRFADKLRNQVEIIRQQKRVREIDIE